MYIYRGVQESIKPLYVLTGNVSSANWSNQVVSPINIGKKRNRKHSAGSSKKETH